MQLSLHTSTRHFRINWCAFEAVAFELQIDVDTSGLQCAEIMRKM